MTWAIVLAAGRSTRMGAQKLLLPYRNNTVIAHVVEQVRQPPVHHTIVVTGADHDAVAAALANQDVTFVRNPDPEADMLSSVRRGVRALPPRLRGRP